MEVKPVKNLIKIIIVIICLIKTSIAIASGNAGEKKLLILNSSPSHYSEIVKGVNDYSEEKYESIELVVQKEYKLESLERDIKQYNPDFMILIGNSAAMKYYHYQKKHEDKKMIPGLIVSFPFVNELIPKMKNTIAIRYEVPIPIIASQMRYYADSEIRNIGVVYRRWMRNYIETSKEYAKLESFNLKGYEIENRPDLNTVKYYFRKMTADNIDAVWILNDDYLMNPKTIFSTIKPLLDKLKKPVLVNSDSLVQKEISLGTFSVVPDQYSVGVNAIEIINSIMKQSSKNKLSIDEIMLNHKKIIEPISTIETMNMDLNRKKGISIDESKQIEIENIIK